MIGTLTRSRVRVTVAGLSFVPMTESCSRLMSSLISESRMVSETVFVFVPNVQDSVRRSCGVSRPIGQPLPSTEFSIMMDTFPSILPVRATSQPLSEPNMLPEMTVTMSPEYDAAAVSCPILSSGAAESVRYRLTVSGTVMLSEERPLM